MAASSRLHVVEVGCPCDSLDCDGQRMWVAILVRLGAAPITAYGETRAEAVTTVWRHSVLWRGGRQATRRSDGTLRMWGRA